MGTATVRDGMAIAFARSDEGPALIQVGGTLQHRTFDLRMARLAPHLAPRFTIFHCNRRGHSGDTQPYVKEREVDDLDALIKEAGGAASVFSMASGAIFALDAAARLIALVAADRRGDTVELFLTQAVGVPAEFVAPMRDDPAWSGMEAVATRCRGARWAAVTAPRSCATAGRARRRVCIHDAGARGRPPPGAAPHLRWSGSRRRPGCACPRVGGVLHRLTQRPAENRVVRRNLQAVLNPRTSERERTAQCACEQSVP
jgi:pimeloyl-ACP methyl ester carboxylesterase